MGREEHQTLLEVKGLSVVYSARPRQDAALKDIEFSLCGGRTLGVVGASGAGKSTLALSVSGLLDRDVADISGSIEFQGSDLLKLSEKELSRVRGNGIAMIFQDPVASLDPSQRVIEQVAEVFQIKKSIGKKDACEMAWQELSSVGITPEILAAAPYAHQLSGGQCQRVMIATVLAGKPDLIVADEPTSSLDVILQAQIIALIKEKQNQTGMAVLFISHDLPLVSSVADDILVMSRGKVVERGVCSQVLANPQHDFTAEMISAGSEIGLWRGAGAVPA